MDNLEFNRELIAQAKKLDICITESESNCFYTYMKLMNEWNNKVNLTAITDEKEIILKHFIDSISINKYLQDRKLIIDVGTGAGFPGIPLKILNKDVEFILIDSLNKRIQFLEEVKRELDLKKIELIHSRVEDLAQKNEYREIADIVVSRAVANLRVLVEYMLPFVKIDGYCLCMKGPNIKDEIKEAEKAINILGGQIENIENVILPGELERNIILIKKVKKTQEKYPRRAGIPSKQPL